MLIMSIQLESCTIVAEDVLPTFCIFSFGNANFINGFTLECSSCTLGTRILGAF